MTTHRRLVAVLCALVLSGSVATAGNILSIDTGWYDQTGFHNPANTNYIAGFCCGEGNHNNFGVFDLAGVTPGSIFSASLLIFNPVSGFTSPDASETYTLFNVSTPVATLVAGGSGLTAIYNDLGGGTTYGSVVVSAANNGGGVSIPLNAAGLTALNAAAGGLFAFGGSLTTVGATQSWEFIFGYSGGPWTLVTNAVPEPGTFGLIGACLLVLAALRWRMA